MGYSEIHCHLCGVSFNIGRFRAVGEPRSAAWGNEGTPYIIYSEYNSCAEDNSDNDMDENSDGDETDAHAMNGDKYSARNRCHIVNRNFRKKRLEYRRNGVAIGIQSIEDETEVPKAPRSDDEHAICRINAEGSATDSDHEGDDEGEDTDELGSKNHEGASSSDEDPLEYDSDADEDGDETIAPPNRDEGMGLRSEVQERPDESSNHTLGDFPASEAFWSETFSPDLFPDQEERDRGKGRLLSYYDNAGPGENSHDDDQQDTFYPLWKNEDYVDCLYDDKSDERRWSPGLEHVAGEGCKCDKGYKPHRVTAEEMIGCKTLQCLVRKTDQRNFRPSGADAQDLVAGPDEDFELHGDFFLSGLCDFSPSRDIGWPEFYPHRHGMSEFPADNCLYHEDFALDVGMPFHPWCLEIYKRESQHEHFAEKRKGKHDVSAAILDLGAWWSFDAGLQRFPAVDLHGGHDGDVYRSAHQWWAHNEGSEYLATNPLYIPGLRNILNSAISTDPEFDIRNYAFPSAASVNNDTAPPSTQANDPFTTLPPELRMVLLTELQPSDIGNLRLVSRSFNDLPNTFFYALVRRKMPWLWEAWGNDSTIHPSPDPFPYSIWTRKLTGTLKRASEVFHERRSAVTEYVSVVSAEHPEMRSDLLQRRREWELADTQDFTQSLYASEDPALMPFALPLLRTNWYQLYCTLTQALKRGELKGLRNRERIWGDCGKILKKMDEERMAGLWPTDNVVGLIEQAHALRQLERERRQQQQEEQRRQRELERQSQR